MNIVNADRVWNGGHDVVMFLPFNPVIAGDLDTAASPGKTYRVRNIYGCLCAKLVPFRNQKSASPATEEQATLVDRCAATQSFHHIAGWRCMKQVYSAN